VPLPGLRSGAAIEFPDEFGCDPYQKRRMYTVMSGPLMGVDGTWVPRVHVNCVHNEYASLMLRTLGNDYEYPENHYKALRKTFVVLRSIARRYDGESWSRERTAASYDGSLRRRYEEACVSLDDTPLDSNDWRISGFLKGEKIGIKTSKPRMIFPRSPRYNLELACFLKPFEHWLWPKLKGGRFGCVSNTRIVAKGLNPGQRARLIARKYACFDDPVVLEVDGKSFESHVDSSQLGFEHSVYLTAFGNDSKLRSLLSRQLVLEGKTALGLKFSREGGRASGDFNTGMGNSLIMVAIVSTVMRRLKGMSYRPLRWDFLCDGDNAIIFFEKDLGAYVKEFFGPMAAFHCNSTMQLENEGNCMESIRFGQSAPVLVDGSWTMVREPLKVVSHITSNYKHLDQPLFSGRYLKGVAMCEASLAVGLPILQTLTSALYKSLQSVKNPSFDLYRDYQILGVKSFSAPITRDISAGTRESFARAFGISVETQLITEKRIEDSVYKFFNSKWKPAAGVFAFAGGQEVEGFLQRRVVEPWTSWDTADPECRS